jgi:hypothetical protein
MADKHNVIVQKYTTNAPDAPTWEDMKAFASKREALKWKKEQAEKGVRHRIAVVSEDSVEY